MIPCGSLCRVAAVRGWRAARAHMVRLPRRRVPPVLHAARHWVDERVHRAIRVELSAVARATRVSRRGACNPGECRVVGRARLRRPVLLMREVAPNVPNRLHSAMEGDGQLEHVRPKELVDRTRRDRRHALRWPLLEREVSIWVVTQLAARSARVADGIRRRYKQDASRVHQSPRPLICLVLSKKPLGKVQRCQRSHALVAMERARNQNVRSLWLPMQASPMRQLQHPHRISSSRWQGVALLRRECRCKMRVVRRQLLQLRYQLRVTQIDDWDGHVPVTPACWRRPRRSLRTDRAAPIAGRPSPLQKKEETSVCAVTT